MAKHTIVALYALIVIFGYLSYLLISPFLSYLIMGALFGYVFFPVFRFFDKKLPGWLSASLVIVLTLILIIIPGIYVAGEVITQASNAYQSIQATGIIQENRMIHEMNEITGVDFSSEIVDLLGDFRNTVKGAIPSIITSTGMFIIGLFILFFVMYYSFIDGRKWFNSAVELIPVQPHQKNKLRDELITGTRALIYGHIVTSLFVGMAVGILFLLFKLPNPIFWAFLAIILGILPFVGASFVYIPASIYIMWQVNWVAGIALLVLSAGAQMYIDYVLRPLLVSARSTIHPVLVIAGVLGGLLSMGVVGFLLGPLILNVFVTLLGFDYVAETKKIKKKKSS